MFLKTNQTLNVIKSKLNQRKNKTVQDDDETIPIFTDHKEVKIRLKGNKSV